MDITSWAAVHSGCLRAIAESLQRATATVWLSVDLVSHVASAAGLGRGVVVIAVVRVAPRPCVPTVGVGFLCGLSPGALLSLMVAVGGFPRLPSEGVAVGCGCHVVSSHSLAVLSRAAFS